MVLASILSLGSLAARSSTLPHQSPSREAMSLDRCEAFECRQRQVNELEALSAIYDGCFTLSTEEENDLQIAKAAVESCSRPEDFSNDGLPRLSFSVEQRFPDEKGLAHAVIFTLPVGYPTQACCVRVRWDAGRRGDTSYVSSCLQQYAESLAGEECGMQLVKVRVRARVRAYVRVRARVRAYHTVRACVRAPRARGDATGRIHRRDEAQHPRHVHMSPGMRT